MLEIERAGVKDHGVVTGLLKKHGGSLGWKQETDRDRWDRVLAELLGRANWLFLLAEEEGRAVGLAAVEYSLSLFGSCELARVYALAVNLEHRGKGVGTNLLQSVLDASRRRGCRKVLITVDPDDQDTLALCGRLNFQEQGIEFSCSCDELSYTEK